MRAGWTASRRWPWPTRCRWRWSPTRRRAACAACRKLRLIQSLWAGVDRLLLDPTLPPGVPIARMVDPAMNASMAETALWATLALHRGYFEYARSQRQGLWQPRPQRRADSVRVLVLGLGQMGLTSARRIAQQGYRVSGWSLRARVRARPGWRASKCMPATPHCRRCWRPATSSSTCCR